MRRLLFLWAEIIRGIPLIFVIFWLWYLLPMLTGGDLPGAVTVTPALAWFTAASVMHSVLAGLQSLPKGQYEAALTGFAPGQTLRPVLLPQALRNVQPSLVGIFIGLLKDTSLAFIVNVPELTTVAGRSTTGCRSIPGDLRLHRRGVLPAVLRSEPAGQPALYPPRDHQIRLTCGTGLQRTGIADLNKFVVIDQIVVPGWRSAGWRTTSPGRRYHASLLFGRIASGLNQQLKPCIAGVAHRPGHLIERPFKLYSRGRTTRMVSITTTGSMLTSPPVGLRLVRLRVGISRNETR